MMKSEFIDILEEISPTHPYPTDEEYKKIEIVYTYHPSISDKEDIVRLWANYGNIIIEDMTGRAQSVMCAEQELQEARVRYEKAKEMYEAFLH